jgi:hypothetical protein
MADVPLLSGFWTYYLFLKVVWRNSMKTSYIFNVAVVVIFCFTGIAFSDNWKGESGKGDGNTSQYYQSHHNKKERPDHHGDQGHKNAPDTQRHGDYKMHRDYDTHNGYRERPYAKNRRYGHYEHHGHRYDYQGHWRSWEQWNTYAKNHPEIYRHGDYYREDTHLMFRFCDPGSGACFFFSIGR